MKKLIILAVLLVAASAFAADQTQTLKFNWQQTEADLPNLANWTLYWSDSESSGYALAASIPYTSGAGPDFTSNQPLTVTGMPGQLITKYFMMTATGKNGKETAGSNVVSHTFTIPYSDVTAPQSLTIQVIVQTN